MGQKMVTVVVFFSSHFYAFRPFWVKWTHDGQVQQIQFGSGDQVGKHELLFFSDDNPIAVDNIQVSSFEAGVVVWEFMQGIGNFFVNLTYNYVFKIFYVYPINIVINVLITY